MNGISSFLLPALLGLTAGVGHGVISHKADLPLSLSEQLLPVVQLDLSSETVSGWEEE